MVPPRWDLFCKVIDNYGDIGVAWRLARSLAIEHGIGVRLWVDDLASLGRIWPEADAGAPIQTCCGVEIRRWIEPFPSVEPGEVVIELFQCEIPESFVQAMAARATKPRWINLDYLSAESWVSECHALPSPHPRYSLVKHFYFPGFDAGTGGLLLEQDLFSARDAFLADPRAIATFWHSYGLDAPREDELRVSMFCYETAPLAGLVETWAQGSRPLTCLVPEGRAADQLRATFQLGGGDSITRGRARLRIIPFSDQDRYDRLLWACHVNFVRGEDSFVRAQWAQHAFAWNIYPQGENTHWIKLNAFLDRYCADLDAEGAAAVRDLWRAWNGVARPAALADAWTRFIAQRDALECHSVAWARRLAGLGGLAAGLVKFCQET